MTGSPADARGGEGSGSGDIELRRRRARYRAWHRGIREMDLIMGSFADAEAARMSEADVAVFERLLDVPDPDIYAWITGEAEVPRDYDSPVFRRLAQIRAGAAKDGDPSFRGGR